MTNPCPDCENGFTRRLCTRRDAYVALRCATCAGTGYELDDSDTPSSPEFLARLAEVQALIDARHGERYRRAA
jgi:hypothetical protein